MSQPNYEQLARVYLKIRDAREKLTRDYEEKYKELSDEMDVVGAAMLSGMQDSGQESIRTSAGTISKSIDIKPSVGDWGKFYAWVKKHDAFEFLERRVKKTSVAEYMEAQGGKLPPGVSVLREFKVSVRRPTK